MVGGGMDIEKEGRKEGGDERETKGREKGKEGF